MKNTSIFVDSHGSVTLSIDHSSSVWAVDGNLIVICPKPVSVGIGIGEKSSLEHLINRWFHSGHEMTRREGRLLGFCKVIFRIFVED